MIWEISAYELRQVSETLKDILTDCFFAFDVDEIRLVNVDPERVVYVEYKVKPKQGTYSNSKLVYFPFYIQTLHKVMRNCQRQDMATLRFDQDILHINIYNNNNMKNSISLRGLVDDIPVYITPNKHFEAEFIYPAFHLYKIFHELGALARQVEITIHPDQVIFQAQDETGTSSCYTREVNIQYEFNGKFITKYLEKFCKTCITAYLRFRVARDYPLNVCYDLAHGSLEMSIASWG